MAKAMTAATRACPPDVDGSHQAARHVPEDKTPALPLLVAKNVLFWGSISLSLYMLYEVVTTF